MKKNDQIVLILGDQLSHDMSSLSGANKQKDLILMAEVMEEATYVPHHKKKITLIFSAMRNFAEELRKAGWTVRYVKLDDAGNTGTFTGEIGRALKASAADRIVVTEPGEWRVRKAMESWSQTHNVSVEIRDDDRFLCSVADFAAWAEGRKQLRMEYFYREMRKKTGLLMREGKPVGGKWNFDSENRKPAKKDLFMPVPPKKKPGKTTKDVIKLVESRFGDHFGDLEPFWFGVTAQQAQACLDGFIENALPNFGDFQDAMLKDEPFLYHSLLSFYINIGLLNPLDVCKRVEKEYLEGRTPLNAAEGFIRQIIGWREYVRGIYWLKMPAYVEQNFLNAKRALPDFYWTGETDMACLRATITQTKQEAYAHHIQRLMITGNFALLLGVAPKEVHEWYLLVYADAFEWVELPNTLGMSQFADGGLLASKPYGASGNYINKMSDYCGDCKFDVKRKTGERACPYNYLYWDFFARNEKKLQNNARLSFVYRTWNKMDDEKKHEYRLSAAEFLKDFS